MRCDRGEFGRCLWTIYGLRLCRGSIDAEWNAALTESGVVMLKVPAVFKYWCQSSAERSFECDFLFLLLTASSARKGCRNSCCQGRPSKFVDKSFAFATDVTYVEITPRIKQMKIVAVQEPRGGA